MTRSDETQDATSFDGWAPWQSAPSGSRVPRLRLLYHCDPARLGAISAPASIGEEWVTLGRKAPVFQRAGGEETTLDDPQVSREQLHIRWLASNGRFQVQPIASSRRPLARVVLEAKSPVSMVPITGLESLEPGACIAIGDRVLLGLELAREEPAGADRLGISGESEAMWILREEIRSVAAFGRPALVTGPTGAGKELVARAIHALSPRAKQTFVPVNCAALPKDLVESALFGHKKGAFSGAAGDERGLFRAADGGTLFLDELAELPLEAQSKLLRVLQDGVVTPVGAHEGIKTDVRLVTATHRDLAAEVAAGRLREDLFHRVTGHVLRVPPLAERRFDIPGLFAFFAERLRAQHPALEAWWTREREWQPAIPIGFIAELLRRPWSGNVRELENVVEQTARLNLAGGDFRAPFAEVALVEPARASLSMSVPSVPAVPAVAAAPAASAPATPASVPSAEGLVRAAAEALGLAHKTVHKLLTAEALLAHAARCDREALGEEERAARLRALAADALFAMLEASDFNQSAVAGTLGTSRTTLIKMMDDLGLPRAAELEKEAIDAAREQAGGDLDRAARLLRVSPAALKKRITLLNLKSRG